MHEAIRAKGVAVKYMGKSFLCANMLKDVFQFMLSCNIPRDVSCDPFVEVWTFPFLCNIEGFLLYD